MACRRAALVASLTLGLGLASGCKQAPQQPEPETPAAPTGEVGAAEPATPSTPFPRGEPVRHPSAAIVIDVPPTWTRETDETMLALSSPEEEVVLVFIAVPAAKLDAALEVLDAELDAMMTEVELSELSEGEINGMVALIADGSGLIDGVPFELGVVLALSPDEQIVIGLGLAQMEVSPQTTEELGAILQSLRPAS